MPLTPRRARSGISSAAAAVLLALAACGAPRSAEIALPDAAAAGCAVAGPGTDGRTARTGGTDTLEVGAPGPLSGRRPPVPASYAERIAYRHLYATLVEVDCRGRIGPGLATSWTAGEGGRRWTFRLGTDRAPLAGPGPGAVAEAWRRSGLSPDAARDRTAAPLPEVSVPPGSDARVAVVLRRPAETPALFASTRFAVTGRPAPAALPDATGSHRLREGDPGLGRQGWTLRPRTPGAPVLRIVAHGGARRSGRDPRDLLDRGVDLLVTRRPGPRRYASALAGYRVEPLPWDRTYVLLVPAADTTGPAPADGGDPGREAPGTPAAGDERAARALQELARDAVRADARSSRPPHWWRERCVLAAEAVDRSVPGPGAHPAPSRRPVATGDPPAPAGRLLYPADDRAAADVAARLAALSDESGPLAGGGPLGRALEAARRSAGPLRAVAAPPGDLDRSLRRGRAAGYVLPLPRRVLSSCRARVELARRIPWLVSAASGPVPLVDTRAHLAVRRGVGGVRLDWDGVPRLDRAFEARPGAAP